MGVATEQGHAPEAALGLPAAIRCCLFDLDGVLTATATVHAAAWKTTFDAYLEQRARRTGAPFVPFDAVHDYERYVDGKLRADGVRSFLASRGIAHDADLVETIARDKDEAFVRVLGTRGVDTFAGSIRYARAVRRAGLRMAVVSASKHCRDVLGAAKILDLFDVIIDGWVAGREHLAGKPAPDTYLAAARALGVTPPQAAVFEDALSGVEAGRRGGFGYVVGVDRLGQGNELRRHGADVVVTDVAELLERA